MYKSDRHVGGCWKQYATRPPRNFCCLLAKTRKYDEVLHGYGGGLTNCSRLEAHLRCRVSSCQHCTHGTCSRRCTAPPATTAATPPAGECQNQQRYQSPASDARSPTLVNGRVYSYKALCHSVVVESHPANKIILVLQEIIMYILAYI